MPTPTETDDAQARGHSLSLGYRLFLSIIITMGLLVTLLLLAAGHKFEQLEESLGRERNHIELERLRKEWQRDPSYRPISVPGQHIWLDDDPSMPAFLKGLRPGFDGEVEKDDHSYSVLVTRVGDHRVTIASESARVERSEDEIGGFLRASWVLLMLAIIGISYLLVRHLILPVSRFAEQIDRLDPSERGINLQLSSSSPEIRRMARAFNRYLGKMDEYVERQHAFAAMASHELRSPLTVVQTSAELIESLGDKPVIKEHGRKIIRASQGMDTMIHALLAVTRDHNPERDFEDIDLYSLVRGILDLRQQELLHHNIEVKLDLPTDLRLFGHRELLQVVIGNLLDNAIRHSDHSIIDIHWRENALCISDQGPGIDESMLENLFERGVSRGSQAGYGLGLYISRLISDKLGWTLQLRNTGKGTEACLRMPPVG